MTPTTVGPVHHPGEAGYDTERLGYNRAVEHRPALVVAADGPGDVVAAVRHAAGRGLPVAVQATGHGPSVPSDGLLISTRRMAGIRVDPVARTARVEAGVRSGALVRAAAAHGLAPLNGSAPDVGVVSYHLGGGVPVLGRCLGWAADRVRAVEIVTADGRLRLVTARREPELFWALRGTGRGVLGVVTAIEIELHPVSRLYGGGMHFPAAAAADVLRRYAAWTADAPEEMGSSVLLVRMPDVDGVPEPLRGRAISHVRFAFTGSAARGRELVHPFRTLGPLTDTVCEMPYRDVGSIHGEPTTPVAFHARNSVLRTFDAAAAAELLHHAGPDALAPYLVELRHLGGALSRPPAAPVAPGRRDGEFVVYAGGVAGPAEVDGLRAALARLHAGMARWGTGGACLSFLTGPASGAEVRSALRPGDLTRLAAVKDAVDPHDLFRTGHLAAALGR